MQPELCVLEGRFTVHRLPPDHDIPTQIFSAPFYSISKTTEELSIVCSSSVVLESERSESGWACIKVLGPLDFALTGILAELSAVLAQAEISIFALSTFDTDYILVKSAKLASAKQALVRSGYTFKR